MIQEKIINELEIRKTIQILKPGNQLFEVRVIGDRKPLSGYFKNADTLIQKLHSVDLRKTNVYMTLNQVNNGLF